MSTDAIRRTASQLDPLTPPKPTGAEKPHSAIVDLTALPPAYLLNEAQVARALGVAVGTLSVWRSTGRWNLKFVKIGRSVRYRVSDLLDFIEQRTRSNGATA